MKQVIANEVATNAFSGLADIYNRSRPGYPTQCQDLIAERLPRTSGVKIGLDVGCGTGIFTRELAEYFTWFDSIVGTEPNDEMRMRAIDQSSGTNVTYYNNAAERLPRLAAPYQFVSAASAINWFNRKLFYQSAHSALHPGGVLAIIHNYRRYTESSFLEDIEDYMEDKVPEYIRGSHSNYNGKYEILNIETELSSMKLFSKVSTIEIKRDLSMSAKKAVDYFLSFNDFKRIPENGSETMRELFLSELIEKHFQNESSVCIPMTTRITLANSVID